MTIHSELKLAGVRIVLALPYENQQVTIISYLLHTSSFVTEELMAVYGLSRAMLIKQHTFCGARPLY